MSGSRNVEDLTFTYYTGQDGSVQSGPHCHSCMNGLYHDGKLDEVQFAYVPTPYGFIEFRLRTLLFLNGLPAPFTMKFYSEDISPRKCTLCASATGSQDISDLLDKDQSALLQPVTRKRKLNTDCLPIKAENDIPVKIEDVSMKNIIPKVPRTSKRSQPPTIILSDSEDLDEPRSLNIKPDVAYNTVSHYPMIPTANPSEQTMVPTIDVESTPTAQSDYSAINFPFIRGRHVNEVSDSMTRQDVLTKVAALRATVQTHFIPMANLYFSSMKENTHFHCDHCDFDVWTSCGIAVVHHILSDDHLQKVYTQGLVYSESDDYDRLVNICQELSNAELKKLTKFSWDLSDEVLTSIAKSYFRDMKKIYCHHCNVIFKAPLGSKLIRHYLSPDHFQKVTHSGRCFSKDKDLNWFKRIYEDAAAECRPKR